MREIDGDLDAMAHAVIGAAIEVHRTLGPGFLEAMYEEALCIELEARGIPFTRQVAVVAMYRGKPIGSGKLDLLIASLSN
jgi:GxxExxY protein